MLSNDGVWARFIFAFCFFLLSGSELLTGWMGTLSGVAGTVELATALMRYSPLYELMEMINRQQSKQGEATHL